MAFSPITFILIAYCTEAKSTSSMKKTSFNYSISLLYGSVVFFLSLINFHSNNFNLVFDFLLL